MAHESVKVAGHPAMDYPQHEQTYDLFIGLMKWGTVACVVCMIILAVLTL